MIERAIAILKQAGFDLTSAEMADILWLATQMGSSQEETDTELPELIEPSFVPPPNNNSPKTTRISDPSFSPEPKKQAEVYTPGSRTRPKSQNTAGSIPIKIPAATALPDALAVARSLRPLMRKVPSPTQTVLDEEATVRRIVEQKNWIPVLKAAPTRWLELAIVIEYTSSTAVWQPTLKELQHLLEHHGAFRDVRTWQLTFDSETPKLWTKNKLKKDEKRFHSPQELIDPSQRRLILLVSDCISPAWYNKTIYPLLQLWGSKGMVSVLQLLPNHLWYRTALESGTYVQLRSLTPGVPNTQLKATDWEGQEIKDPLKIPIITLEPNSLYNWSQVIAGNGSVTTTGVSFNPDSINDTQNSLETAQLIPLQRVSRFRATASPTAQRLAGLLAATPVSLPIVHLIQRKMLPKSRQIHVAEVFMSGLLEPIHIDGIEYQEYEFIEGVREKLLEAVPKSQSTEVIYQLSEYIAKRLGLSIDEFEARLMSPQIAGKDSLLRPFATITAQVLKQLGGEYLDFAEEIESYLNPRPYPKWFCYQTLSLHHDNVTSVCFSPDGQLIASGCDDGTIYLGSWQNPSHLIQAHKSLVHSVAFSPDGRFLASASRDHTIKVWDIIRKQELHSSIEDAIMTSVTFTPDARKLIGAGSKGKIVIWDLSTLEKARITADNRELIWSVACSPDGKLLISGGASGLTFWELEAENVDEILSISQGDVWSVTFSPNGRMIASGGINKAVLLRDLEGKLIEPMLGHEKVVYSVAFSPNGQMIASGSKDKTIRLWDLQGRELDCLEGHEAGVNSVAFSPDGQLLASSSGDRTIKLWCTHTFLENSRHLLWQHGNTKIYSLLTDSTWLLPFDALVLITNSEGSFGELKWTEEFSEFLGQNIDLLEESIYQVLYDTNTEITPNIPLLLSLPTVINQQLEQIDTYSINRSIICTTIHTGLADVANVKPSTTSVLRLVAERKFTRLVVSLVGNGVMSLDVEKLITNMLQAMKDTLQASPSNSIREITLISKIPKTIATLNEVAQRLFTQPEKPSLPSFPFETVTVNRRGEIIKRQNHTAQYFTEILPNQVPLEMVYIPGGTFFMGSPKNEKGRSADESPQHKVTVPPFFMSKYLITQAQWKAIAALDPIDQELDLDPSHFKSDNRPVERVNWYAAREFCKRLSKLTGKEYRLPSEAEWEYACRAGTTTPFYFGATITTNLANYRGIDSSTYNWKGTYRDEPPGIHGGETISVGQFSPNAFGLYDMHGNVWEWCLDDWHDNYDGAPTDGSAWLNENESQDRPLVLRGGSWYVNPVNCRSADRGRSFSSSNHYNFGIRVVCGVG